MSSKLYETVCLSVRPLVCLSVRLSVALSNRDDRWFSINTTLEVGQHLCSTITPRNCDEISKTLWGLESALKDLQFECNCSSLAQIFYEICFYEGRLYCWEKHEMDTKFSIISITYPFQYNNSLKYWKIIKNHARFRIYSSRSLIWAQPQLSSSSS